MPASEIRVPILKRLAEQAMSDAEFRSAASVDLDAALTEFGYELNARELELVHKFRATLAEAGVDLMLDKHMDLDSIFDDASPEEVEKMLEN